MRTFFKALLQTAGTITKRASQADTLEKENQELKRIAEFLKEGIEARDRHISHLKRSQDFLKGCLDDAQYQPGQIEDYRDKVIKCAQCPTENQLCKYCTVIKEIRAFEDTHNIAEAEL